MADDKPTPAQNLAKAIDLLAPLRDRNLSETDRALVHLSDVLSDLLASAPAPASGG